MVDRFLDKVFQKMDQSKTVQKLSNMVGIEQQVAVNTQPIPAGDPTMCIVHRNQKKNFFCEEKGCLIEICGKCKETHDKTHPIKLTEVSSKQIIERYQESLIELKRRRLKVNEASNIDPTTFPLAEGCVNILDLGNAEIDRIFVKLHEQLEACKQEMKDRLCEAYKANYKATID